MFRSPSADLIIVLVIVLLFLGPKRLPGLGRSLGSGIREFKHGIGGGHREDEERPELPAERAEVPAERAEAAAERVESESRS
jgi:sec-independent protein translocase protein TatA